jgi:hypothetical protein
MTAFLYYSVSSGLTENELVEIDRQIFKNQESVYLFLTELPSNSKRKGKKLCLYIVFMFAISQPLAPCGAVVMPLPTTTINKLYHSEESEIRINKNYPQIAPIPASKVDKMVLTDQQIEDLNLICYKLQKGSITIDKAIFKLRAGGFYDWATLAFIIYMFSLQQGDSFQNVPLPHMDLMGWASGKYDSKNAGQCPSNPPSRFERETFHRMKQMCAASADENGFVMNYDEAIKLLQETYSGSMQVTEDLRIGDWQAAKKAYHGQKGFDIDLGKYRDFSKEDLVALQNTEGGFIPYVQKGGKLPPIEFVQDFQQKVDDFCHLETTEIIPNAKHYGNTGETSCTMFFNRETRQIVLFNNTGGDFITAEKFRAKYFAKCVDSGKVGKPSKPTN